MAEIGEIHIDPHVHCRDWEQSYKATIKSVTEIARNEDVVAIFDMPNTSPSIISEELVKRRLNTAKEEGVLDGYYLYMGLTKDPNQIKHAAEVVNSNPKVVGMKMYAGKSVGNLEITQIEDQRTVYQTLADANYTGVIAVHCESEKYANASAWKPEEPSTWNLAKPPIMEVEGIKDQINLVKETGFKGHLHICHISTVEGVKIVDDVRSTMKITCGVTPHHIVHSTLEMKDKSGVEYKVNPPVRDIQTAESLKKLLLEGKIDWIETDHAPHSIEEKSYVQNGAFMSGIQSLKGYKNFLNYLMDEGMTKGEIHKNTYLNIKKVFKNVLE